MSHSQFFCITDMFSSCSCLGAARLSDLHPPSASGSESKGQFSPSRSLISRSFSPIHSSDCWMGAYTTLGVGLLFPVALLGLFLLEGGAADHDLLLDDQAKVSHPFFLFRHAAPCRTPCHARASSH